MMPVPGATPVEAAEIREHARRTVRSFNLG
jgi:hypothetical protein